MKTSNLPETSSEMKKKNRELQHMKFIQNYSESFNNQANKNEPPNLMGYNKSAM